uniref:Uncharacterized protein n=1 Tax=Amphimedon queenslandica TaxID=400682 RepID=A0A1X7V6M1_AMPQE
MASGENYDKCSCCQWRYATSNARLNKGGPIEAKYCNECKGGHDTSAKYPGRELFYSEKKSYIPSDPSPKPRPYTYCEYPRVQYVKCWCCEYRYKQSAVVKLNYQCRIHSITVCITCAWQHQTCPKDYDKISIESERSFNEKVENSSDDEPYQ